MKLLSEISSFPEAPRNALESQFGITSAEAFFEHAVRNPVGLCEALKLNADRLEELRKLTSGYLAPAFIARCPEPAPQHSRGVIVK